jgi:hypothetical protein
MSDNAENKPDTTVEDAESRSAGRIILTEEDRRQIIRYFETLRRIHTRLRMEGIEVPDDDECEAGQNSQS